MQVGLSMLSLTRKADYALVGLVDLARRAPEKASARQLAESSHVPLPMLMNILKDLVAGGMVISTRGVNGGYRLGKDPSEITLRELIQAIEGPIKLTICCSGSADIKQDQQCDLSGSCPTEAPIRKINEIFRGFLDQITLAHLLADDVPITIGLTEVMNKIALQPAISSG